MFPQRGWQGHVLATTEIKWNSLRCICFCYLSTTTLTCLLCSASTTYTHTYIIWVILVFFVVDGHRCLYKNNVYYGLICLYINANIKTKEIIIKQKKPNKNKKPLHTHRKSIKSENIKTKEIMIKLKEFYNTIKRNILCGQRPNQTFMLPNMRLKATKHVCFIMCG